MEEEEEEECKFLFHFFVTEGVHIWHKNRLSSVDYNERDISLR